MLNQEAESNTARPNRHAWIYNLVGFLVFCVGCVALWIYVQSAPPPKEESLSDVKAWGIARVEQMPYVQGEHKQEILNQINQADDKGEVQGIVSQAQKDNGAIRVIVAARHVHYCDEGIMSDGHYVCWDGKVSQNSKESE